MLTIPPRVAVVVDLLRTRFEHGLVYATGGCIRDMLMGREPKDIDLATSILPPFILGLDGAKHDDCTVHALPIGLEHGTVVLIVSDEAGSERVEVTTLRRDLKCDGRHAEVEFTTDIYLDLERRDFTINAMALDLTNPKAGLIDPFGGQDDLKNHTIRAVGDPELRFKEDYLRMVRACRFAGYGEGFTIEPQTWAAIGKYNSKLLDHVARERIREELIKMMKTPKPSKCINALRNTGLLQFVVPPVHNCVGVEQNRFHAETVYEHITAVCDHLPANRPLLRLVGLLHDVGKPITKEGEGDSCSFHNHEIKGARIAYNFMRDYLKFSNEECEYVSLMVRHHMYHFDLNSKKKTIKRWLRKVKGLQDDLFILRMADRAGNKAKVGRPLVTTYMEDLQKKCQEIIEWKEPMSIADLNISGRDLIEMGYTPGPQFGVVLRALLERVLDEPALNEAEKLKELAEELFEE
jgi:putative nucleotidyltransferase with HDIG domain